MNSGNSISRQDRISISRRFCVILMIISWDVLSEIKTAM